VIPGTPDTAQRDLASAPAPSRRPRAAVPEPPSPSRRPRAAVPEPPPLELPGPSRRPRTASPEPPPSNCRPPAAAPSSRPLSHRPEPPNPKPSSASCPQNHRPEPPPAPSHLPPEPPRTEPPAPGDTSPVTYISIAPSRPPTPCAPRPVQVRAPLCGIDLPESHSHPDPPEAGPHPPRPIVAGQGHERQLRFSGASTSHPRAAREPENVRPARYLRTDIEDDWTFERI
jgi:hypothetical protein